MTQPELFPPKNLDARYRRSNPPATSRAAHDSVQQDLRGRQIAVLDCLKTYRAGLTLEQLVYEYSRRAVMIPYCYPPQSDSGIRTRCSELVKMGLVRDTGRTAKTASGRNAIVWEAVQ